MIKTILITGGAGFIGANSTLHFARQGWDVCVLDNLSRRGAMKNLEWLREQVAFRLFEVDVRDAVAVAGIVKEKQPDVVLHLAAQVAVTTSIEDPRQDLEINVVGTFNMLEAIRQFSPDSFFINASTNKVYGALEDLEVAEANGRYRFETLPGGIDETRPLDFHSPYGCSKGAADQYTIDYARIYDLKAVTLRQSCIYGPRQFGIEDQGWVAWFIIAAVLGKDISIFGNGKQVRDILHVEDLIASYQAAIDRRTSVGGHAFNIGGGPNNSMGLLELIVVLEEKLGRRISWTITDSRPGDQSIFVCNLSKARRMLEWEPRIRCHDGVISLIDWVQNHRALFGEILEKCLRS